MSSVTTKESFAHLLPLTNRTCCISCKQVITAKKAEWQQEINRLSKCLLDKENELAARKIIEGPTSCC